MQEHQLKALKSLANSSNGKVYIQWLEDKIKEFADVRNVQDNVESRKQAVDFLEKEILSTLKSAIEGNKPEVSDYV